MGELKQLPLAFPDKELYARVLQKGFEIYPERKKNYERYQAAQRGVHIDFLPVKMDIENVSRCNYHCTMCEVSNWPGSKRAADMSLEDYRKLIDEQYGLIEIKLQGLGEPLMGKCYFDMIRHARERHVWVRSTTNGSLLHVSENYRKIIDSDICELSVSIDGCSPATYEKIRRGGHFDLVTKNCALLNDYAMSQNRKRTRINTVVQKDNFHELEQFPVLAGKLGFERLSLSLDLNDWGKDAWKEVNDPVDMHSHFSVELGMKLIEIGARNGVAVTFWYIDHKYDWDKPEHLCPWPFHRPYISSDLRIVPCCMIANPETYDLGDARKLGEAWNGPKYQGFRQAHLQGKIPGICKSCYKARA